MLAPADQSAAVCGGRGGTTGGAVVLSKDPIMSDDVAGRATRGAQGGGTSTRPQPF